jgi:hypothetical protein
MKLWQIAHESTAHDIENHTAKRLASHTGRGNRVPFLNGGTYHLSAALGADGRLLFNPPNGIGQMRILNALRHPFAVIPLSKMVQPRLLIDALRELHEENEIVRA